MRIAQLGYDIHAANLSHLNVIQTETMQCDAYLASTKGYSDIGSKHAHMWAMLQQTLVVMQNQGSVVLTCSLASSNGYSKAGSRSIFIHGPCCNRPHTPCILK